MGHGRDVASAGAPADRQGTRHGQFGATARSSRPTSSPLLEQGERLPAAWVAAAQARREALFARAERRRRLAGAAGRAAGALAEVLPFSIRAVWPKSPDLGPRPQGCQWIYGDGPFSDADKCGAPAQAGRSFCRHHQARLLLDEEA